MPQAPLISIVDDDALARDGIRELVDSLGYNSATFMSAEHFLEDGMIAETTCLITDLQMPGLSGLELQQALRSQGYHTPVILITAYRETPGSCAWQRSGRFPEQTVRRKIAD
jgi:FixJ family two-component response regulator